MKWILVILIVALITLIFIATFKEYPDEGNYGGTDLCCYYSYCEATHTSFCSLKGYDVTKKDCYLCPFKEKEEN